MHTLGDLLRDAAARLAASPSPRLDAELLLCHVLGRPRSHLYAWPEQVPDEAVRAAFEALLVRRIAGEPVAFLLGWREFFGRRFRVTPDTLVPRPETELLVETVLARLPADAPCRVLDLGTGSGAIAVTLGLERPGWQITAVDASEPALQVAADNARTLGATRVTLLRSDWFTEVQGRFHAIVSNPPYIPRDDVHLGQGDVRFEPRSALVSGADGLDAIRAIVAAAPDALLADGLLALEHGYDQAQAVAAIMTARGFRAVGTLTDLAGHPRVTTGVWRDG